MSVHKGAATFRRCAASATHQARAWTAFWQEQGADAQCLAEPSPQIRQAFEHHWYSFAARLPPSVEVLDIGCGSGNVARLLTAANPHLRVVGIDVALVPAARHPRIEILAGTAVESLPLPDSSIDAAVSRFGYEYSHLEVAAKELARVLRPGAPFSFIVHHSQSPIVGASRLHNQGLRAVTGNCVRQAFLVGDENALRKQLERLGPRHCNDTAIRFAAECLISKVRCEKSQRLRIWRAFVDALSPDRTLADALESSCVAADGVHDWLAALRPFFEIDRPCALLAAREPIAWRIEGRRIA